VRVLHVVGYYSPAFEWGGPARSIPALARAEQAAGMHVEVITTTSRGAPNLPQLASGTYHIDAVAVHFHHAIGPRRFFFSPALAIDLARRLREADLLHIHGLFDFPVAAGARIAELRRKPYVLSPTGMLNRWALAYRSLKKRAYLSLIDDRTLRTAALLQFSTAAEARECPSTYAALQRCVVPIIVEPLDLETVPPIHPNDPPLIALVGRLHPVKGFDVALPMLARLHEHHPTAVLEIAGADEDGYRATLEREIRTLGLGEHVRFLGFLDRPRLSQLLARARVVIAPSHQESFGLAAAEAMAAARPVVLSPAVNIAADVGPVGAACVVERTADAFATAVADLLAHPARARDVGERGRQFVLKRYAPAGVAAQMGEAYERVLAHYPSPPND